MVSNFDSFAFLGHVNSKFMGTDVNINVMAHSRDAIFNNTDVKSLQPRFFVIATVMSCALTKVWTFVPFFVSVFRVTGMGIKRPKAWSLRLLCEARNDLCEIACF